MHDNIIDTLKGNKKTCLPRGSAGDGLPRVAGKVKINRDPRGNLFTRASASEKVFITCRYYFQVISTWPLKRESNTL